MLAQRMIGLLNVCLIAVIVSFFSKKVTNFLCSKVYGTIFTVLFAGFLSFKLYLVGGSAETKEGKVIDAVLYSILFVVHFIRYFRNNFGEMRGQGARK